MLEIFATAHASWHIWRCGSVAFGGFGGFVLGSTLGFQGLGTTDQANTTTSATGPQDQRWKPKEA